MSTTSFSSTPTLLKLPPLWYFPHATNIISPFLSLPSFIYSKIHYHLPPFVLLPSLLCGHYHFVSTTSLLIPCWNHHLPLLPHVATTSLPSFISFLHAKWNQHFGRVYKQTLKRKCKLASILYKINIYIYISRDLMQKCMRFCHVALCMSTFSFSLSPPIFFSMISLNHKRRKLKDLVLLPFLTFWTLPLLI